MQEKEFTSGALRVNLEETRIKDIEIPEHHQEIINLSENHWGINKRAKSFFEELNHPYANHKIIIDEYRKILLGDRWLYEQSEHPEKAILFFLDIAFGLFRQPIKDEDASQLLRTYLEFFGEKDLPEKPWYHKAAGHLFSVLDYLLEHRPTVLIQNADLLKKHLGIIAEEKDYAAKILDLVKDIAGRSIDFWRNNTPTEAWFEKRKHLFSKDYSHLIKNLGEVFFEEQKALLNKVNDWDSLSDSVFFYHETAAHFRSAIDHFDKSMERFYYILFLLHLPGMENQRTQLLWELNKVLRNVRNELDKEELTGFLDNIFELFDELKESYMTILLDCILTLGKEVIEIEDRKIISLFENKLIELGFVGPGSVYIQDNWQLKVDPNHVKNIRTWLELIMHAPYTFRKLLSALIVNLRLGGIFIFDTDLFQRDISRLLNSNISPLYKQIKQLTRIFPVYFNEIGAEGELRDVTTVMDEISGRQDTLIHFLRKQVHIEGNNTHIDLCKRIFHYWFDGDKAHLDELLPQEVSQRLDTGSRWFTGVNNLLGAMSESSHLGAEDLLKLSLDRFEELLENTTHDFEDDKKRLGLLFKLYALLREKYSFDATDITSVLSRYHFFSREQIDKLKHNLENDDTEKSISEIFDLMEHLNEVIFSKEHSEGWESIYHKRHIAFGIPSMYGQYREDKFEALGLIFRLERVAATLMEEKIYVAHTEFITARSLKDSYDIMALFRRGLELDGVTSQGLDANLQMLRYGLTSESFTLGQFINLFQFMSKNVKDITNTYFFGFYDQPLRMIIPQIFDPENKLSEAEKKELLVKKSESFYREILYASFLIQPLDNYISRMIHALQDMVDNFPPDVIRHIMSYDPDLVISPVYESTPKMDNQIFLGSKAYFQKMLYMDGFPVPPGFVLSTEVFRRRKAISSNPSLDSEVDELIRQHLERLEKKCGRGFGLPENPLLLSVRSGTAISMPGAMNTFLNVGLNDEVVEALSKQSNFGWTSWDCYRRLLQSWGMTYGINRDVFDQVMIDFKDRYEVEKKTQFTPDQMREMAFAYKEVLAKEKVYFEEDPWKQLKQAIMSVFDSWGSERANVYRDHLQIADQWGTAVVIQQMVLGNIDEYSGTGVVFTQNSLIQKPGIYLNGDFTLCSQGEDIVAGLVHALPVSISQKKLTGRENQESMEELLPDIYARLREIASDLVEKKGFSHQEIEFTFESPDPKDLYILQIRDQDTHKTERLQVFLDTVSRMQLLGRGIGGGGGALNGRLAIDMDDIMELRKQYPDDPCILMRPDTVPDDIPIIFECDGLVAARGGTTSHAAVTAARLGKVCVLNCRTLHVNEKEKRCIINGDTLLPGDKISIDGFSGNIYKGHYQTDYTEIIR